MTEAVELVHILTGDTLRYAGDDTLSGLYKIRIPAGTTVWGVGVQTYRFDEPATAVMSMDAPPVAANAVPVDDTRRTLQRLWAGETLHVYSPGNSGTLSISQLETGDPWRADRDRWLYIDVRFPAGKTLAWQSHIVLSEVAAPLIAPSLPEPDLALAQRTLEYAHKSGLVVALMKTSGSTTDEELIEWMLRQGDLWFSVCRLVGLAEGKQ